MPDEIDQTTDTANKTSPPIGDSSRAEGYIQKLIKLIDSDKIIVHHTDLSKFNLTSMANHYFTNLGDHQIEVSHSKQPENGTDSYVLIFTNIKLIQEDSSTQKVILAYMHLETNQFIKFKTCADDQIERFKKAEEEKRLNEALEKVDQVLDGMIEEKSEKADILTDDVDDIKKEDEVLEPKTLSEYSQINQSVVH